MSAVTETPAVRTRTDLRSLPGETGMVERPRRRFLPFDPWHLFLAPLAAVMLLPLLWMPQDSCCVVRFWGTPLSSSPRRWIQLAVMRNPVMRAWAVMPEKPKIGVSFGYAQ